MYYTDNIKKIARQKGISLKHIAKNIGMSEGGFHQALSNDTLTFQKVLQICEILECMPNDLLEDENYRSTDLELLKKVNSTLGALEKRLKQKERYKSI